MCQRSIGLRLVGLSGQEKKVMDRFRSGASKTGWAVRSKRSIYGVEVALKFGTVIGP